MISILVPTHALDTNLLQRLADSVDFPIKNKIVINNGKPGSLEEWSIKNSSWNIIQSHYNIGVAASWNLAPEIFKEDAWLILNDDQQLQPGCLEIIARESEKHSKDSDVIYVNEHEAYDIFVWTRKGFEAFGNFDENFYPIYYEDWDMKIRFEIGNANKHFIKEHIPIVHGKPHAAGKGYTAMLDNVKVYNYNYMLRKWGVVDNKKPLYKTPFNTPELNINHWALEMPERWERRKISDAFFNDVNVSLY